MKFLARLRRKSTGPHGLAPNPGEPLLSCFDCQRSKTLQDLTLFPWWDEQINGFFPMYRCARCLPKARKQVLKQLMKNEEMLINFVDFASQKVVSKQLVPLRYRQGTEALDYARQILDALVAHEACVRTRSLGAPQVIDGTASQPSSAPGSGPQGQPAISTEPQPNKCKQCKSDNNASAVFCTTCGASLRSRPTAATP